jgi:pyrroline-5-carboxylate reductase
MKKAAIIGCGHMGSALAKGLSSHLELFLYDRNPEKVDKLKEHGTACQDIEEAIRNVDAIILAVKPQGFSEVAKHLTLKEGQIFMSIMAGISIAQLKNHFPHNPIIRLMPNMPILYQEGIIGIATEESLNTTLKREITKLFSSLGSVFWLQESLINPLTSLASSGVAFFFAMTEAMIEAGHSLGFSETESRAIVTQMVQGGLTLLEHSKKPPSQLITEIASPGGTTIAGLKAFEEKQVKEGIIQTFLAANTRAQELAQGAYRGPNK